MYSSERKDGIWAMLANWQYYDSLAAANARHCELWLTGNKLLKRGDPVLIWQTLDDYGQRGIVGLGCIASKPALQPDRKTPYQKHMQVDESLEMRTEVISIPLPDGPLWIDGPHADVVSELTVSRGRGSATFYVTQAQWDAILTAAGLDNAKFNTLIEEALQLQNTADHA